MTLIHLTVYEIYPSWASSLPSNLVVVNYMMTAHGSWLEPIGLTFHGIHANTNVTFTMVIANSLNSVYTTVTSISEHSAQGSQVFWMIRSVMLSPLLSLLLLKQPSYLSHGLVHILFLRMTHQSAREMTHQSAREMIIMVTLLGMNLINLTPSASERVSFK